MKQWLVRRGSLATVAVATLGFALHACSSEPGERSTPAAAGSAQPAQDQVDELVTTPQATQRFARLAKQFQRLPSAFNEPVFQPPSGLLPPKTNPRPFAAPDPLPVLSK